MVDTELESQGEDRNGLGIREPTAWVPRKSMEKLRRD